MHISLILKCAIKLQYCTICDILSWTKNERLKLNSSDIINRKWFKSNYESNLEYHFHPQLLPRIIAVGQQQPWRDKTWRYWLSSEALRTISHQKLCKWVNFIPHVIALCATEHETNTPKAATTPTTTVQQNDISERVSFRTNSTAVELKFSLCRTSC